MGFAGWERSEGPGWREAGHQGSCFGVLHSRAPLLGVLLPLPLSLRLTQPCRCHTQPMTPADVFKSNLMGGIMEAGWPSSGARNLVRFSSRVSQVGAAACNHL